MKFYFSGVSGQDELSMLRQAGVRHILVDPSQMCNVLSCLDAEEHLADEERIAWRPSIALDSGAYRAYKAGTVLNVDLWERDVVQLDPENFDFVVAPDVFGDPGATLDNWDEVTCRGIHTVPVWHWDAPRTHLLEYLNFTDIVGIGGLVMHMREKNERVLRELLALCAENPQRFHLFGLAWPKAIDALAPYAYSADSSIWLRGARYAMAIFQHAGHGHLTQCPSKFLQEYQHMGRRELCIQNAQNIEEFCDAAPTL